MIPVVARCHGVGELRRMAETSNLPAYDSVLVFALTLMLVLLLQLFAAQALQLPFLAEDTPFLPRQKNWGHNNID